MSTSDELRVLKHEERVLMKLAGKLNEQLNRLKVEELALMSKMRTTEEETEVNSINSEKGNKSQSDLIQMETESEEVNAQPLLDLAVCLNQQLGLEVEEEEEEEEEDEEEDEPKPVQDQLSAFIEQLESDIHR